MARKNTKNSVVPVALKADETLSAYARAVMGDEKQEKPPEGYALYVEPALLNDYGVLRFFLAAGLGVPPVGADGICGTLAQGKLAPIFQERTKEVVEAKYVRAINRMSAAVGVNAVEKIDQGFWGAFRVLPIVPV